LAKLESIPLPQIVVPAVLVVAVTGLLSLLTGVFTLPYVAICYLIPVAVAASHWGGWSAAGAVMMGAMATAYFFYPPLRSLWVDNPQQKLDLALFAIVAAVLGYFVIGIRAKSRAARLRAAEVDALHHFSRRLAVSSSSGDIYAAIEDHLSKLTGRRAHVMEATDQVAHEPPSHAELPNVVAKEMYRIASSAAASPHDRQNSGPLADWLVRPLSVKGRLLGVVGVDLGHGDEFRWRANMRRVEAVLDEAAATLERIGVGEAISEARLRTRAETLRQALIGSVSHELCTPLASIMGAASILAEARPVTDNAQLGTLAAVIRDEAERLNADIQTLLNASRISSENVTAHLAWTDVTDVVNAAIDRWRMRLSSHELAVDLAADLPLVKVDSLLIEQALGQVLDNARKYAPPGSMISISARQVPAGLTIEVADNGMGLTESETSMIWERFYRSPRVGFAISGSGLGLWVARALTEAGGGTLSARSPGEGRGAIFSILVPVTEPGSAEVAGAPDDKASRACD
jgi:two-component system sensor histidine kinase KdpD